MSTDPQTPPAPAKRSRRGLFIILALVVVVLAGGGAGGYYWFFMRGSVEAAVAEPEPPPSTGLVPLDAFVVNLADPTGSRFLRITLSLIVQDEEQAAELKEDPVALMRVRSAILELLALNQADKLVTPDGKSELKKSIAAGVAHVAHEIKVTDVLFSEFIVQF